MKKAIFAPVLGMMLMVWGCDPSEPPLPEESERVSQSADSRCGWCPLGRECINGSCQKHSTAGQWRDQWGTGPYPKSICPKGQFKIGGKCLKSGELAEELDRQGAQPSFSCSFKNPYGTCQGERTCLCGTCVSWEEYTKNIELLGPITCD
jgi:hypothetical protein